MEEKEESILRKKKESELENGYILEDENVDEKPKEEEDDALHPEMKYADKALKEMEDAQTAMEGAMKKFISSFLPNLSKEVGDQDKRIDKVEFELKAIKYSTWFFTDSKFVAFLLGLFALTTIMLIALMASDPGLYRAGILSGIIFLTLLMVGAGTFFMYFICTRLSILSTKKNLELERIQQKHLEQMKQQFKEEEKKADTSPSPPKKKEKKKKKQKTIEEEKKVG